MISFSDVSRIANNKQDFHQCMIRNGYYVPKMKSKATTLAWIQIGSLVPQADRNQQCPANCKAAKN